MGKISDAALGDLFLDRTPKQITRRTDPSTSFQAADGIIHKLRPLQWKVYETLKAAGSHGLTDLELEERCGSHGSTYRTRRAELAECGLVVDTGRKVIQKGRSRIEWAVR